MFQNTQRSRKAATPGLWDSDWLLDIARSQAKFKPKVILGNQELPHGIDEQDGDDTSMDDAAVPRGGASGSSTTKDQRQASNPPSPSKTSSILSPLNDDPDGADITMSDSDHLPNEEPKPTGSRKPEAKVTTQNSVASKKRRGRNRKTSVKKPNNQGTSSTLPSPNAAASKQLSDVQKELEQTIQELEMSKRMIDFITLTNDQLETQETLLKIQIADLSSMLKEKEDETMTMSEQLDVYERTLRVHSEDLSELKEEIDQKDLQIESLCEQLDLAHFKLRKAERRNRYVDDADRWKADAKYRKKKTDTAAQLFGFPSYEADEHREEVLKERRGAKGLVAKSVDVVAVMMANFNEDVFQTAASYSDIIENEGFEKATTSSTIRGRAERVLGARLVSMILPTITRKTGDSNLDPLVAQVVVQAFLVYWCNQIIEAWYPKQATFAEFLVDVSSKLRVGTNRNICGTTTTITQKHTRDTDNLFNDWVSEIIQDLCDVLLIFGWRIHGYNTSTSLPYKNIRAPIIQNGLLALVKGAYDLRTAMAEISTSGDVDLVIVSCDTPFSELRMEDAYDNSRRAASSHGIRDDGDRTEIDHVVATTGIGLQREVLKNLSGLVTRDLEMVHKPRVVLEYTLAEALARI